METADYEAEAIGSIVAQCSIPREAARDALRSVAAQKRYLRQLVTYLHGMPNALTSGLSSSPLMVDRLISELIARGATGVQRSRCALCGEPRELRYRWENGRNLSCLR